MSNFSREQFEREVRQYREFVQRQRQLDDQARLAKMIAEELREAEAEADPYAELRQSLTPVLRQLFDELEIDKSVPMSDAIPDYPDVIDEYAVRAQVKRLNKEIKPHKLRVAYSFRTSELTLKEIQ